MSIKKIEFVEEIAGTNQQYLEDESGIVTNGYAEKLFFPKTIFELQQIIKAAYNSNTTVTISGGGTGLAGGRVPRDGWLIATDKIQTLSEEKTANETWQDQETGLEYEIKLEEIHDREAQLTVPVSITIKSIQNYLREKNWFYPPDPTERSAYIGGNISTNASGARSFKFGPTRNWVDKLKIILSNGELIKLSRDDTIHKITESYIELFTDKRTYKIPRPKYALPEVRKNVAGPVITDQSHPIDLFIGTDGIFGVIAEPTLRLCRPPNEMVNIFVYCKNKEQALDFITSCRIQRDENIFPIPLSVEYVGPRATNIMKQHDEHIPSDIHSVVILEQDAESEDLLYEYLEFWIVLFDKLDIPDSSVAQNHKEIEHHKYLRHTVPETVNNLVRGYNQSKVGTDYSVPPDRFKEIFNYVFMLGDEFEEYQKTLAPLEDFGYAFWAHAGDSHIHLNLLPRSKQESIFAKKLLIKLMNKVVNMGGSIAAEHGLGKKTFEDKPALFFQYGNKGLNNVRDMKLAIDPKTLLNRGNLIEPRR